MSHDSGFNSILGLVIESVNAGWVTLDLILLLWFGYYMWTIRHEYKVTWRTLLTWSTGLPLYAQAAIAIFIFHTGDFGVRGIVWWIRHQVNQGEPPLFNFIAPATLALCVFALIAWIGLLCKLRVFSTPMVGRWAFWAGGAAALTSAIGTHFLP